MTFKVYSTSKRYFLFQKIWITCFLFSTRIDKIGSNKNNLTLCWSILQNDYFCLFYRYIPGICYVSLQRNFEIRIKIYIKCLRSSSKVQRKIIFEIYFQGSNTKPFFSILSRVSQEHLTKHYIWIESLTLF